MMRRTVLSLLLALAAAGCGVGAGEDGGGSATLTVTRDFGVRQIGSAMAENVPAGETIMRLLQRRFDVDTRYGGGFVQSIEGIAGGRSGGRQVDWFFYVNGIESSEGAGARRVWAGDRIWWDLHDWGAAMRIPAVVGSFPEPFLSGSDGRKRPVRLDCAASAERECDEVGERLQAAGVKAVSKASAGGGAGEEILRVLVGPWREIRNDRAALQIERGPEASGVFARFHPSGERLDLLDERGRVVQTLTDAGGLVAATRYEEQQPTWVVTGVDAAGVAAAASALEEAVLKDRFAVGVAEGRSVPVPVRPEPVGSP